MIAAALLAVAAAAERQRDPPPDGQIPLTRNEITTLFASLIIHPPGGPGHRPRWSAWRRHQHRAKTCHYQRQAGQSP
jgi:hypothetical protein